MFELLIFDRQSNVVVQMSSFLRVNTLKINQVLKIYFSLVSTGNSWRNNMNNFPPFTAVNFCALSQKGLVINWIIVFWDTAPDCRSVKRSALHYWQKFRHLQRWQQQTKANFENVKLNPFFLKRNKNPTDRIWYKMFRAFYWKKTTKLLEKYFETIKKL